MATSSASVSSSHALRCEARDRCCTRGFGSAANEIAPAQPTRHTCEISGSLLRQPPSMQSQQLSSHRFWGLPPPRNRNRVKCGCSMCECTGVGAVRYWMRTWDIGIKRHLPQPPRAVQAFRQVHHSNPSRGEGDGEPDCGRLPLAVDGERNHALAAAEGRLGTADVQCMLPARAAAGLALRGVVGGRPCERRQDVWTVGLRPVGGPNMDIHLQTHSSDAPMRAWQCHALPYCGQHVPQQRTQSTGAVVEWAMLRPRTMPRLTALRPAVPWRDRRASCSDSTQHNAALRDRCYFWRTSPPTCPVASSPVTGSSSMVVTGRVLVAT